MRVAILQLNENPGAWSRLQEWKAVFGLTEGRQELPGAAEAL